jgi:hypothetical protein
VAENWGGGEKEDLRVSISFLACIGAGCVFGP